MTETKRAEETLLRAYAAQLYREYTWIVDAYEIPLRPPLIQVTEHQSTWGSWYADTRTIALSRKLIQDYPWDIVLEILKHEMAHQMVSELRSVRECPHGEAFQEACRRLHVAEWAARAAGEIPDTIEPGSTRVLRPENERLLKKVEKLLSLAGSSNEHEALLAMKRVRELYARHNLESWHRHEEPLFVRKFIYFRKHRIEKQVQAIFSLLIEHFFVRVIFTRSFDAKTLESYRAAEIVGTRENVEMADYVYHFLVEKLDSLWKAFKRGKTTGRTSRRDYQFGVVRGFRRKLNEEKERVLEKAGTRLGISSTMALVHRGDARLREHVRALHPILVTRRSRTTYRDAQAFQAGLKDGKAIVLRRGLSSSTERGRLLPTGVAGDEIG